eukprot:6389933-Prymnesium_polylepis.1
MDGWRDRSHALSLEATPWLRPPERAWSPEYIGYSAATDPSHRSLCPRTRLPPTHPASRPISPLIDTYLEPDTARQSARSAGYALRRTKGENYTKPPRAILDFDVAQCCAR